MFKIATEAQIRAAEQEADASGLSYDEMMQRAGRAVADRALHHIKAVTKPQITTLVGPGNNGGDGIIASLFIAQDNPDALVRLYLLKDRPDDPYLKVAQDAGLFVVLAENDHDKRLLRNLVASSDLVIDALFGLGVRLPLRDEPQKVLRAARQAINERRAARPDTYVYNPTDLTGLPQAPTIKVLAVDVPSGVEADTGKVDSVTLRADETISFITARRGHFIGDAVNITGELLLANLGFSPRQKTLSELPDALLDADAIREMLPPRAANSHKGTYGHALVIGGSESYYGAPMLAATGAYRVGAGLVTIAASSTVVSSLAPHLPEAIWVSLAQGQYSLLDDAIKQADAILVGPGLSQSEEAHALLNHCLKTGPVAPFIIDADALNLLAASPEWHASLPTHTVLTPHPAEMARLTGLSTQDIQADRFEVARTYAQMWRCVVVLKGAHTIVAAPDGKLMVSPFKTDALAKAGTGDTLAGIITGLVAQGLKPVEAAQAGCYLHGAAGKYLQAAHSGRTVMAHEVSAALSEVFKTLDRNV